MAIEGIILKQEKKSIVPPMFCAFLSFILLFHDFPSTFGIGKHLWGLKPCIFSREHLQDDLCFKPSRSPSLVFFSTPIAHPWVSLFTKVSFPALFVPTAYHCSSMSLCLCKILFNFFSFCVVFVRLTDPLCSIFACVVFFTVTHKHTHTHTHTHCFVLFYTIFLFDDDCV